jgi:hypothetical protein
MDFWRLGTVQDGREIDATGLPVLDGVAHLQHVRAPDHLLERTEAHTGHQLPHLLGEEEEVVDDVLGRTCETLSQLGVLRRDTDGARVQVADAHHDATRRDERRSRECELFAAEECGDHHVAASLELAVGLQDHTPPQIILYEDLLCLGEPELPRKPCMLYGRER